MESRYSPQEIEAKWYALWENSGAFSPQGSGKPYTIVIPPPNVTGALHMGHALNHTLQDVLIRAKRMQGYRTLWQPGTDHAGIATQSVVERALQKEGKRRQDLGREKFVERVWEWKNEYGNRIVEQLKRLGASCDWSRLRFTMDEGLSRAVAVVFVRLHEDGLIYRGARLVNWCPKLQTALADEEVENKETAGHFWSIRYLFADDPSEGLVVSTTRPETLFGDVAVAVHPDDVRYKNLIGKKVLLPIIGRAIPIIADEHADPNKGTGAVKITPAHDFNDYEVGLRHQLKPIVVLNLDATLNQEAGPYAGMERFAARKKLVAELEACGLLVSVEDRVIPIPTCYRSGDVVEPTLLSQWYVKMKPLAEPALECVEKGETRFIPERYTKTYRQWLEPFRDWCISRQLWWGHQIPVWYVISQTNGELLESTPHIAARNEIEAFEKAEAKYGKGASLKRDEDVLDTWFSSALWPFSTLGWPDSTPDLKTHFPTDVLITGRDIIYFWVARMIFSGLKFQGKTPFHTVYIHGTILDEKGQRMSKSKGNGIDPIEMIEKYGADAVRFGLMTLTTEGQDIKLSPVKFEGARNFANKLWNAVRFVHPHLGAAESVTALSQSERLQLTLADRWIMARCAETVATVTKALESDQLKFSDAAQALYRFTWDDFCSRYLEIRKKDITGEPCKAKTISTTVFVTVLRDLIAILHPFMPYLTEEIQSHLGQSKMLILGPWPKPTALEFTTSDQMAMNGMLEISEAIRQIRGNYTLPPQKALNVIVSYDRLETLAAMQPHQWIVEGLERVESLKLMSPAPKPSFSASTLLTGGKVFIPLEGILDLTSEKTRLNKELERAKTFAASQEKKLSNEKFVQGAPAEVVESEREKLRSQLENVAKLESAIADLG